VFTDWLEAKKHNGEIQVGNIDIERDFIDVRDVSRAYIMIMKSNIEDEIINVCNGRPQKLTSALKILDIIKYEPQKSRFRPNDIECLYGCNKKLRSIGWKPTIDFNQMLCDLLRDHAHR
jgi:GDP-4-dehydro-6-deoxy-D-mannose reductase